MTNNKKVKEFSRRDFLKTTGTVTGGIIGGSLLGGLVGFNMDGTPQADDEIIADTNVDSQNSDDKVNFHEARMTFKRREDFNVLSSATEVIFPEDDIGPGAIALGVPYFIDRQLATPWAVNAKDYMQAPFQEGEVPQTRKDIMLEGIRAINDLSKENHDDSFDNLNTNQQTEILTLFDEGEAEMKYISSTVFFNLLRNLTLEGLYSDPLYGGNKNMEGWRMKEYPGAQLSYRNMMAENSSGDEEFTLIEPVSLSSQ